MDLEGMDRTGLPPVDKKREEKNAEKLVVKKLKDDKQKKEKPKKRTYEKTKCRVKTHNIRKITEKEDKKT